MEMRVRLPELLEEKGITAYRLATDSGGRISLKTVYRLVARKGAVRYIDSVMLDALCDVLKVTPAELLARDHPPRPRVKRARKRAA